MTTTKKDEVRKWLVNNYFFFQHLDCAVGSNCGHRVHADKKLSELFDLITQYGIDELTALKAKDVTQGELKDETK